MIFLSTYLPKVQRRFSKPFSISLERVLQLDAVFDIVWQCFRYAKILTKYLFGDAESLLKACRHEKRKFRIVFPVRIYANADIKGLQTKSLKFKSFNDITYERVKQNISSIDMVRSDISITTLDRVVEIHTFFL